jgi:hypothetical protein
MASPSPAAEPVTAAAAKAAAVAYFALYGAQQYQAAYGMLSPAARSAVSGHVWDAAHMRCLARRAPLSYRVAHPVLAGDTAVVKVSLAGVLSRPGSEEASFVYSGGRWWYSPPDLSVYRGHDVAQAVTALKSLGVCG